MYRQELHLDAKSERKNDLKNVNAEIHRARRGVRKMVVCLLYRAVNYYLTPIDLPVKQSATTASLTAIFL